MLLVSFAGGQRLRARIDAVARRATVAALVSVLAACGGGGGGATSFPIAIPSAPSQPDTPPAVTYRATLTPTAGEVAAGKTLQLKVALVDSQGNNIANPPTAFASSDPAVAAVASTEAGIGIVTGVAKGSVQVTARVTAPDGTQLSQQATVSVVAVPLTYRLVLANPTIDLQYDQPMTVGATILASDGTDATAAASGWSWSSSDSSVVAVAPSGSSASLLAGNARPKPAVAVVTVQAVAPNGAVLSGQIAVTALLHYTYRVQLSATSVKVATDRTANVSARVIRSDGRDMTSSAALRWTWTSPAVVEGDLVVSQPNSSSTAISSTRPDKGDINAPDGGFPVDVTVKAEVDSSNAAPAVLFAVMYAKYTFVDPKFGASIPGNWGSSVTSVSHSSADDQRADMFFFETCQIGPRGPRDNGLVSVTFGVTRAPPPATDWGPTVAFDSLKGGVFEADLICVGKNGVELTKPLFFTMDW